MTIRKLGAKPVSEAGFTTNISSGGVLLFAEGKPNLGPVEYAVTLQSEGTAKVELHCFGRILRCALLEDGSGEAQRPRYQIAATLERYRFRRLGDE